MQYRGEEYEQAVYAVVALVPVGKVLTYGDIAEVLERGGPRQVGAVLSRGTAHVPWWRVISASGRPPKGLGQAAIERYLSEGTPLRQAARGREPEYPESDVRVDMKTARWNPDRTEQDALQTIRRRLSAGLGSGMKLSEADGALYP